MPANFLAFISCITGLTEFADLSQEQFKKEMLIQIPGVDDQNKLRRWRTRR
jgi:hypothetical protein